MTSIDAIRTLTVRGRSDGLDKLAIDLAAVAHGQTIVNQTAAGSTASSTTQAKAVESTTAAYTRLQGRLEASNRVIQQAARDLKVLQSAAAAGVGSPFDRSLYASIVSQRVQNAGAPSTALPLSRLQEAIDQAHGVGLGSPGAARASANAFEEEFRRIEEIAVHRGRQIGEAFAADFNAGLRIGIKATDNGATFSALAEQEKRFDEIDRARAAHDAEVSQRGFAERFGIGRSATDHGAGFGALDEKLRGDEEIASASAKAMAEYDDELRRLREFADPGAVAQEKLNQTLANAKRAYADGRITLEEYTRAEQRVAQESNRAAIERTKQLTTEAQALKDRFDPKGAARRQYEQQVNLANEALALGSTKGGFTPEEHGQAISHLKAEYEEALQAADNFSKGLRLNRNTQLELLHIGRSIFDELAVGVSPLRALTLESGRLAQVMAMSGGLGGTFRAVGATFAGLLTPTAALAAGIAGAALVAVISFSSWIAKQKELENSLKGLGQGTGATLGDLNAYARQASVTGRVSIGEAQNAATEFAKTGAIGTQFFAGLIQHSKDYARITGQDTAEANRELAQAFADPSKGADTLNQRLGGLNDTQREAIRLAAQAGDEQKAQALLFDYMKPRLADAEHSVTALGRAWDYLKNTISGVGSALGETINSLVDGPSNAQRAAAARAQLFALENQRRNPGPGPVSDLEPDWRRAAQPLDQQIAEQQRILDDMREAEKNAQLLAKQRQQRDEQARNSITAGEYVRQAFSTEADAARDQAQIDAINKETERRKAAGEAITAQEQAVQRLTQRLKDERQAASEGLTVEEYKEQRLSELRLKRASEERAAGTTTLSPERERFFREQEQRYQSLGSLSSQATRNNAAENVGRLAQLQAENQISIATQKRIDATEAAVEAQKLEIDLFGKTAREAARLRFEYEHLRAAKDAAAAAGTTVSKDELAAISKAAEAYGKQAEELAQIKLLKDAQFQRENQSRNPTDQASYATLNSAGLDAGSEFGQSYIRYQRETADLKQAADDVKSFQDLEKGTFKTFISDLIHGKNATDSLTQALTKLADKLLDITLNDLLSGSAKKGQASSLGGLFGAIGNLFGIGGQTSIPASLYHVGGVVGYGASSRRVPASLFWGAPRFHDGLGTGEFAAILKAGEYVLTQQQAARAASTMAGLGAAAANSNEPAAPVINVNNYGGAQVQARKGSDGALHIDIDRAIAGYIVQPRSAISQALASAHGTNPAAGIAR